MSRQLPHIDADLAGWIVRQHVFFVATAPLSESGHINVSPKGGDALRILGPREVAYQDYTGSGVETAAHLRENGRIVIMLCDLDGSPKTVRLHGRGEVIVPSDRQFGDLAELFPANPGRRAIVKVAISRVSASCGLSVPMFDFRGDRDALDRFAISKGPEALRAYRTATNATSIDGLPAFDVE
jgi:hypothetical protein